MAFDTTVKKPQQSIFTSLTHLVPRQRSLRERMVLAPTRLLPTGNLDSTNRSRSLTYIAAAIRTAARENVSDVVVPENGQLAINPPLTPGRRAACSTRSVHPWIIGTVNRLIADVGGSVRVRNPLLSATKGEVCRCALDSGLAPETLLQTVSCGRPTTARWDSGRTYFNCGICFPCLVRRSGLHAALGGYDDSGYAHTLSSIDLTDMSEQGRKNASHLRDLIRWIDAPFTVDDLLADTPYPPTTSPQSVMPVLERGRGELGTMLTDLVPDLYPVRRPLLELHRR
ncbi:hypothetical protein [Nocardia macrotermitis]|uniref:hypothetical protein n=1 Tax=Nocardia macrotermitis TaxID=2585198 RepID=UPI0012962FE9|nr:hypothetical protein [Nocardia macrotermitis]